ncbi:MAG: hypothetical protein IKE95_01785 [Methanobrevibacter sp.]|nr:hypothetical protein [Methanobrevibacter sp.]
MNDAEIAVVDETTATPMVEQFDIVDVEAAKEFMDNYQKLVNKLLDESDYQMIGDKKAKKKSAWRKLATAFHISDEIVNEELVYDDTNQIISARYKVRATLPNGRSTIGVGACSIFDKIRYKDTPKYVADKDTPSNFILRGRFSNAEHDVPSTAHTRAKNRAIADLIGAGEVTADELDEEYYGSDSSSKATKSSNKRAKRRTRRTANKPKEEGEVIETKAEVVEENSSTTNDFKEAYDSNNAIKQAINKLQEAREEITKANIIDELFSLYDLKEITEEDYFEAKELVE